ncbi:MAG: S-methyl-5'-thioadenosine phosphorylase [Sorangium cellulosum]|nr:MAG: S-methyl-5'-thioadenosine phosphorylase [Sorangium cellulosum]
MNHRKNHVLAVIGGSGLYDLESLENVKKVRISTPFGKPSGDVVQGTLGNTRMLFLPRHGEAHSISPSAINYRANICALKLLGATHVLSISAVGSMKEEIEPGHIVLVDQFVDLTKRRESTFFDEGLAAHVAFADPVCPAMLDAAAKSAEAAQAHVHRGGSYVCIEGPQFSTRAESLIYRSWGVAVVGMTNMPEAKLAREAELPFCTLALATDYDCWHESEEAVTAKAVVATLKNNVEVAKRVVVEMAKRLPDPAHSPAYRALAGAMMTAPHNLSAEVRSRLDWLLNPYLDS